MQRQACKSFALKVELKSPASLLPDMSMILTTVDNAMSHETSRVIHPSSLQRMFSDIWL